MSIGCCGAIKGFRFLHVLYAIIISGIILAEIGLIAYYLIYQNRFKYELSNKLKESITNYYAGTPINRTESINPISVSWDFLQFNLQCCGAINQDDYSDTNRWNRTNPYDPSTNLTVPFTCCPLNATKNWSGLPTNMIEASTCAITGVDAYSKGCYDRLVDFLATYKKYLIISVLIVVVLEMIAFSFAIVLYSRRKDYYAL